MNGKFWVTQRRVSPTDRAPAETGRMSARLRASDLGRMALAWAISSLALIAAAACCPA